MGSRTALTWDLATVKNAIHERTGTSKTDPAVFHKTGLGEYAHHDRFLGIPVPSLRKLAGHCQDFSFRDVDELMASPFNEERLLALLILIEKYERGAFQDRRGVYDYYTGHFSCVNNWNLVDASAHLILGRYLFDYKRFNEWMGILIPLSVSPILWERRIAMVATWYFIRQGIFDPTITIAQKLLPDDEDLIHKAVGWMLREVGKREVVVLKSFLDAHVAHMPPVMVRYSIEKFDPPLRAFYLGLRNRRGALPPK